MYLGGVTVSMRVISAGDGYKYLLRSVAAADGARDASTSLTRYYAASGTPPGFWLGAGVTALGAGEIRVGDEVTEKQLARLLGAGHDPITGEPLGRAYPQYKTRDERIADRLARLDPGLSEEEKAEADKAIRAEEAGREGRRAVAGYDFTFSVPKSVSVLWALADGQTQAAIAQAHHEAIADVIALLEREVAATRTGYIGADGGAVAQVDVTGLIATAFDHFDSRSGDPQLHTHVVLSNKVKTVLDGKWRSLDGRPIHAAVVAVSEHYNALLADHLTRLLGIGWDRRERGRDRNPAWEITGVPEELIKEFSTRTAQIEQEKERLIDQYVAAHGRQPSSQTIIRLRAQATLATRPDKEIKPLSVLTSGWREQADRFLGQDATTWARGVVDAHTHTDELLRAGDLDLETLELIALLVVGAMEESRSTWRRWNLYAEAGRQTMQYRFASSQDREIVTAAITDAATRVSVRLTPPELASSPKAFVRTDGTSVLRPRYSEIYTSEPLWAAESRLLESSASADGPSALVGEPALDSSHTKSGNAIELSAQQRAALAVITGSGRSVDVLVGAAGAGKTAAMAALRTAWEEVHGRGSVLGLAPSARAAAVLAGDLDIACETVARWLFGHNELHDRTLSAGQLVIIDEASLAGTLDLDAIASHAAQVGAKVLLVGDHAQLSAISAGGGFAMLAEDIRRRDDQIGLAELTEVRRFVQDWEKSASLQLRDGDPAVLDTYDENDRLVGGTTEDMLDAAYAAWRDDMHAGRQSLMIAETRDTVTALNLRARLDRIIAGEVDATTETDLHDGTNASVWDLVVTRKNNHRLKDSRGGWVKNGDCWIITGVDADRSLRLRRADCRYEVSVVVPADYVAEYVELAYATTVHRAEGMTVDTAHALVHSSQMTREALYVALTRGRLANKAYVALDMAHLEEHQLPPNARAGEVTPQTVLFGVLQHVGAEDSAHRTVETEHDYWAGIAQLAGEYETIAAAALHDHWVDLLARSGLTPEEHKAAIESTTFAALAAALRHAEAEAHDLQHMLPQLVKNRGLGDADDIAAVLHHRLSTAINRRAAASGRRGRTPAARMIAGLIHEATGPMDSDMRTALDERAELIEQRVRTLAEQAVATHATWIYELGTPPSEPGSRAAWLQQVRIVAAYRDRYGITGTRTLGPETDNHTQQRDAARARSAITRAKQITTESPADVAPANWPSPDPRSM